jgi:putative NIF3 family GTP cyclohydrolase 1 type 2
MVVVHHGLFWERDSRVVDRAMKSRLQVLIEADITLAAYHLALDAHPELGNNALLARELGIDIEERLDVGHGGTLSEPLSPDAFTARVRDVVGGREPLAFLYEPAEPTMMAARELGIHFIAGGHYATERLGVQALSARLATEFALEWHFIELTNPV